MKKLNILNLHGYGGTADNELCRFLRSEGHNVFSPQLAYDSVDPKEIEAMLAEVIEMTPFDCITATSFGSFVAKKMATMYNFKKRIFLNPCFSPDVTLNIVDPCYLALNREYVEETMRTIQHRGFIGDYIFLGTDDELIDHAALTRPKVGYESYIYMVEGGGHSLPSSSYAFDLRNVLAN